MHSWNALLECILGQEPESFSEEPMIQPINFKVKLNTSKKRRMNTQETSSDLSNGKEIATNENACRKRKMETGKEIVKEPAFWTDDRKKHFIGILLEQARKGGKINTSFSRDAWDIILKQFNASKQTNYDMLAIKNCYRALRSAWITWKVLLTNNSGWGWCHQTQKVNPPTKQHWNDFKAKHKQAVQFLKGPLKFEEELDELFKGTDVEGKDAMCPKEDEKSSTHKKSIVYEVPVTEFNENIAESQPKRGVSKSSIMNTLDDDDEYVPEEIYSAPKKQKKVSTSGKRKSRKTTHAPSSENMTIPLSSLGEMANIRMNALTATSSVSGSVSDALKILDEMEEVSMGSDMYLDAMMLLEDPTKREFFLKMNPSIRFAWLRKVLNLKG
ncbi:L10-interacting MYB domain-containing protein-like [Macadamia integrifolia]|uniref:L10-interacting MYB domain-containing protein-like n=1 Tax=Macadamia integrifolia TaxID=60698 RepID=UPI001C4E5578|nr:L10-interacting MYB domain-containing protein-like [Macadamia integrifolia]